MKQESSLVALLMMEVLEPVGVEHTAPIPLTFAGSILVI